MKLNWLILVNVVMLFHLRDLNVIIGSGSGKILLLQSLARASSIATNDVTSER